MTIRCTITRPRQAESHSVHGGGGIVHCSVCGAVYYRKSWHHDNEVFRRIRSSGVTPVSESICPACAMIRAHRPDGRVIVEHVPTYLRPEIVSLVGRYCERAEQENPEHRLIEIFRDSDGLVLTTTDRQLAVGIGKKIRDAFKRSRVDIRFAPKKFEETRVYVRFSEPVSAFA